jgi:HlyD family secretion protein
MVRLLPRRGPSRVVAVTTLVALAAGAAGFLLAAGVKSPADAAASRQPPTASLITVPVERRALTSTLTVQASVAYRTSRTVVVTGSVAPLDENLSTGQLVTKAPAARRTIKEGDVLMEVNGRPVFALTGDVPMYRTLTLGSTGDDVNQVRAAMRRLVPGSGVSSTGPLSQAVMDAVAQWYRRHGHQAVGPTLKQKAQQRGLERALDKAKGTERAAARLALEDFHKKYDPKIYAGEIIFLPKLPARVTKVSATTGTAVAGEVATIADPAVVVNATVADDDAKLLKPGLHATITSSSGRKYQAAVASVGAAGSATPTKSKTDDESNTPVGTAVRLVAGSGVNLAKLAGQSIRVTITVGDTGGAVLTVPISAVFTRADGQAHLTVDDGKGGTRQVPVTTGLSTDGYVEVTPHGASLRKDERVVVSGS